jgi:hypothetical protein
MSLAAGGTPVAMKRRAVEPVNKAKILPVFLSIISTNEDSKYVEFSI